MARTICAFSMVVAGPRLAFYRGMYFDHYWGMHMFWWIFWALLIVALVVWVWPGRRYNRDSALDELRRRYAAGEIDDVEYQHRLEVLRGRQEHAA